MSRDRASWVERSTRLMCSTHPSGLELLPNPRIRIERVNPIELKLDLTITLQRTIRAFDIKYIELKTYLAT